MKFKEFIELLKAEKAKVIYLIHKEEPSFNELQKIRRFAELLKASGFIPLSAYEFRPFGKPLVSKAIAVSDFSLVLALDKETEQTAKNAGVKFVYVEEALD